MKRKSGHESDQNRGPARKKRAVDKESNKMPKVQDALGYLEKVKNRFAQQPTVYNQFLDIMKDFKSQAIDTEGVIQRVKTLFKGNRHLILGFNQFLPPGFKIELEPEKPTIEFNHAVQYVAKIKHRFRDQPEIYGEFLDILHDYQAKRTIDEVYQRVQKLFGAQPDLLEQFKYFLPDKNLRVQGSGKRKKTSKKKDDRYKKQGREQPQQKVKKVKYPAGSDKELALFDKIKHSVTKSQWQQFLKVLDMFSNDICSRWEMVRMIEDVLAPKAPDLIDKFKVAIGYDEWEERQLLAKSRNNYYAFVSSVDFSTCKQVTPSYRSLPPGILTPPCSGRSRLAESVLNDTVISFSTGTEDYSFFSTRKNVYEENLFKCEDERFEMDMVIENNAAAIRVLEPFVRECENLSATQAQRLVLDDKLDILHVRAIARLYGDNGYEVVDMLKKNPSQAAPTILLRLKQKDVEWRRVRNGMKSQWRRICEQNYNRSLDHRSFYFKQEDKKRRNTKALVAELKDAHNLVFHRPYKDDDLGIEQSEILRKIRDQPVFYTYCLKFTFAKKDIHEQMYEIITRTAIHQLNERESRKLHTFWQGFVFHYFGVDTKIPAPQSASSSDSNLTSSNSESISPATDEADDETKEVLPRYDVQSVLATPLDDDSKIDTQYKPIRVNLNQYQALEQITPVRRHTHRSKLFFADDAFYTFFRLHQMLFDRLATAKELAFTHKMKVNHNKKKKKKQLPSTPEGRYERFGQILIRLLDNDMDSNRFEDECRALLGASSFVLFTIEKLVAALIKSVQTLVNSETSMTLLSLYKYEHLRAKRMLGQTNTAPVQPQTASKGRRGRGKKKEIAAASPSSAPLGEEEKLELSAELARIYHSNCVALLRTNHCVQVEYFEESGDLGIGYVENVSPTETIAASEDWNKYLTHYLTEPPALAPSRRQLRPFLMRNLRPWLDEKSSKSTTNPLDNVYLSNQLEAKIYLPTYKLQYVDGTDDIMVRTTAMGKVHQWTQEERKKLGLSAAGQRQPEGTPADDPAPLTQVGDEVNTKLASWVNSRQERRKAVGAGRVQKFHSWLGSVTTAGSPSSASADTSSAMDTA